MANTINRAIAYIKEPAEIEAAFAEESKTMDLEVPNKAVGAQTVKYQHIEFGDYVLDDFSKTSGYSTKDIILTWKEKTLTQDKGDSLKIDIMDDEESMANGIVALHNRFVKKVEVPALDKYRLSTVAAIGGSNVINLTLTSSNAVEQLFYARAMLQEYKIDITSLIFYCTSTVEANLKIEAMKQGYWKQGEWNGQLDAKLSSVDGIKILSVPSAYFNNTAIQGILLHPSAVAAMKKYQETVYFAQIPGFGKRRAQIDEGVYHDCWVYDELNRAICLFITTTATKKTITYAAGDDSATGDAPTQVDVVPGGSITLAANAFTLTGKTFVGWNDGYNLYLAGATYTIPNANVTLTAVWK